MALVITLSSPPHHPLLFFFYIDWPFHFARLHSSWGGEKRRADALLPKKHVYQLNHPPLPLPLAGCVAPFLLGDGGRKAEEAATSYAYRIKHVYPKDS